MPIVQLDPSLINSGGGVNAFQNAFANALKIRASQQELDDNQYKIDALREDRGQQNALAQLLANQAFDPKSAQGQAQMYGAGGVKNTQSYLKGMGDLAKTNSETAKHEVEAKRISAEVVDKKSATFQNLLNTVQTPQQAAQWLKGAYSDPDLAPMLGSVSTYEEAVSRIGQDPQSFATWKQQAGLTASKLADVLHQQVVATETGRHNLATEKNAEFGQQVTMRGQNMTDARARDALNQSATKGHYDAERGMMISPQGVAIPVMSGGVPLGEKDKPLTDSQSKALGFGERMRQADKIINSLGAEGTNANVPGMSAPIVGRAITALSSDNQQMLKQAKTDFMTAVLRRESGASISTGEFDTADRQYFPQVGDSDKVIAQKARNRQLALNGVLAEVPDKKRDSLQPKLSSQDSQAEAWAKANPNDPRAAKILQHLGR
jgi:hypothetical protein